MMHRGYVTNCNSQAHGQRFVTYSPRTVAPAIRLVVTSAEQPHSDRAATVITSYGNNELHIGRVKQRMRNNASLGCRRGRQSGFLKVVCTDRITREEGFTMKRIIVAILIVAGLSGIAPGVPPP